MPRGENRQSILLSRDENDQVFSLIGSKCQSLATAVVQLFTTEGPEHSEWKKKDTGVLCLIKDNSKRSYFFRIYCLCRKAMIWEHEVYMQIEYNSPRPYLHTFEAEEYMTAFNFANEDEAKILRNILIEKIELRKQRREDRRQRSIQAARTNSSSSYGSARLNGVAAAPAPAPSPAPARVPVPALPAPQPAKSNTFSGYTMKSSKKPKTRKLTKADIGMPQDFKHVSHVGWDADKGFDVDLPEEEMLSFFSKAGISQSQLQDEPTRQFIYDFINSHGGIDAVKEELHDTAKPVKALAPPPAPAMPAPPVPARSPAPAHPPAPPSRAPPPPPARAVPPPPAPPHAPPAPRNPPPRPPQPPSSAPPAVPPPPPPIAGAGAPPPPPPPPPPPAAPAAPPPPPLPDNTAPPPMDARAALMESIRSGNKSLKHVEVASKAPANEDSRSNLLSEIRQGIELRSVSRSASNPSRAEAEDVGAVSGLAGALARALRDRARVIHSSDSDLSDATTSDGEWDD
ncbi:actin nucleation-promoting factor WAS-like [Epargyreus clarus]|uniref:actin nucleation-promoting factor WAS-like n=1 Tax=Epargyreus clarus TaxID=520877 RepID=UPI003C2B5BAE